MMRRLASRYFFRDFPASERFLRQAPSLLRALGCAPPLLGTWGAVRQLACRPYCHLPPGGCGYHAGKAPIPALRAQDGRRFLIWGLVVTGEGLGDLHYVP